MNRSMLLLVLLVGFLGGLVGSSFQGRGHAQGVFAPQGAALGVDYGTGFGNQFLLASQNAGQTTDIDAGDHIEFDNAVGSNGNITLSTGAGQLSGLVTLPAGGKYFCSANLGASWSNSNGTLTYQFRNNTTSTLIGTEISIIPLGGGNTWSASTAVMYIEPTVETELEIRIVAETLLDEIVDASWLACIDFDDGVSG